MSGQERLRPDQRRTEVILVTTHFLGIYILLKQKWVYITRWGKQHFVILFLFFVKMAMTTQFGIMHWKTRGFSFEYFEYCASLGIIEKKRMLILVSCKYSLNRLPFSERTVLWATISLRFYCCCVSICY